MTTTRISAGDEGARVVRETPAEFAARLGLVPPPATPPATPVEEPGEPVTPVSSVALVAVDVAGLNAAIEQVREARLAHLLCRSHRAAAERQEAAAAHNLALARRALDELLRAAEEQGGIHDGND